MQKKIFAKFLLTYICIAAVALTLMFPLYRISLESSRNVVLGEQSKLIEQKYQESLSYLESFRQFAYNLSRQDEMRRLAMCGDGDSGLKIDLYHVMQMLKKQTAFNPLQCELIFTFPQNDTVVTTSRVYEHRKGFYEGFFSYEGMDFDQWESALEQQLPGWSGRVLRDGARSYAAATYNFYYEEGAVAVSMVVNTSALLQHITTEDILRDGWLTLEDTRFGVLMEQGTPPPSGGIRVSAEAPTSTLRIEGGVSDALVNRGIAAIRQLLWTYIGIALTAFVGLSLYFSARHARPMSSVLQALKDFLPSGQRTLSPYMSLQSGVDSVVKTYDKIRQERDTLNRSYRHMLFNMALQGASVRDDLERVLRDIPALWGNYLMLCLGLPPSGCAPQVKVSERIYEGIRQKQEGAYFHIFKETCVILIPSGRGDGAQLPEGLREELTALANEEAAGCCVGISGVHRGMQELAGAYRESNRALYTAIDSGVICAAYSPGVMAAPPPVDRTELWNMLLHEGEDQLKSWFGQLLQDENLYKDAIVGAMLYYQILMILRQMNLQLLPQQPFSFENYRHNRSLRENFRLLEEQALALHNALQVEKPSEKSNVLEGILAYIQQNFRFSSLSLASLAWHMNLSERYLSALMTEHLGCSYMEYVYRLRMEEAERLLSTTTLPVSEVAAQSGYEYANTFFKAFRRWSGMTPTQYRKARQKEGGGKG